MTTAAPTIPGLADLPPGPEPGTLTDGALVEALQACSRLHAQAHARMLRTLLEVAARSRAVEPGWELMVIATALTWTETKAGRELDFADTLTGLLPDVFAVFEAGAIDHGKAWTFVDILGCAQLTPTQLTAITAKILPQAPRLTTGQIRARLLRAVLAVDPGYRERRYRRAVRERGVHGYLDPDGAGVITGSGLPADDTVAACARLDHLVAAAQQAGHPATKGQLAADVFLRLLDGRLDGMSTEQIITSLLADPDTYPQPAPELEPPTGAEPKREPEAESRPEPQTRPEPTPEPESEPDPESGTRPGSGSGSGARSGPEAGVQEQAAVSGVAGRGVEIRLGLATAIGLDQCPGEVPGWGPVLPEVARRILARQAGGEWRFAVTDPDGYSPASPAAAPPTSAAAHQPVASSNSTSRPHCSPNSPPTPTAPGNGRRWSRTWPASTPTTNGYSNNSTSIHSAATHPPRCAGTSRCATAPAWRPGVAAPPARRTWTTPTITPAAGPPPASTSDHSARATTR